jgi:6-pyruvoyltetrahydropterin/6-carboxytetrahydropterin synthase
MYYLTIEDSFASAHQLRGYKGKCENLHGHNWKVILTVKGDILDDTGLLIDFHILKKRLKEVLEGVDHRNINEVPPFDEINPSSENLARYIYNKMEENLSDEGRVSMDEVTVWESATSRCTYRKPL